MSEIFTDILVSSPNNGGLHLVIDGESYKLDDIDTTGISLNHQAFFRGIQKKSTITINRKNELTSLHDIEDIHDVLFYNNHIYTVGTEKNEILKLSEDGEVIDRWVFGNNTDSNHINCLNILNDRVVFSAFGEFEETRAYKESSLLHGYIQDLESGKKLITGLSQPHSITPIGNNILVANSETKEIREYNTQGELIKSKNIGGYTRGILIRNGIIYIGISCSRNIVDNESSSASLIALNENSWKELGRRSIDSEEIYSVVSITNKTDILNIFLNSLLLTKEKTSELSGLCDSLKKDLAETNSLLENKNDIIARLEKSVLQKETELQSLYSSKSWLVTKPLRLLSSFLKTAKTIGQPKKIVKAFLYLFRGDISGLFKRIKYDKEDIAISSIEQSMKAPKNKTHWCIITTHHTLFIAHLISEHLHSHGWTVTVVTDSEIEFNHNWYIVICPQMFKNLPPLQKCIVFQMEQSISSRWFTKKYYHTLENSLAVLEYSLKNIEFFSGRGINYPHINYLPIGASSTYQKSNSSIKKEYDILFYGDRKSSPRRRKMLSELEQHFNVKSISEIFGHDMKAIIQAAKLVVNIHYYENALLEMPRIQECLSLGTPVVSESSQDQSDYPELNGAVHFFEEGSTSEMIRVVKNMLSIIDNRSIGEHIIGSTKKSSKKFEFMFDRFLMSMGFLPSSYISKIELPFSINNSIVGLSLPETISRRRIFETHRPSKSVIFDGIRRRPGWVGCGLSYKFLAQQAIKQGKDQLCVMEDDVVLPEDFNFKNELVHEFLAFKAGQWDLFSGLIASLNDDTRILSVESFKGVTFVTIDKMTSMVFNIFNKNTLNILASWDPENTDAENNTIDRFLENQKNLRVVVMLPFMVGHREEVQSTLWGFQNTQYCDMIKDSEKKLQSMVSEFERTNYRNK